MNGTVLKGCFFNGVDIRVPKTGHCVESPDFPGSWGVAHMRTDILYTARDLAATGRAMAAAGEMLEALTNLHRCLLAMDLENEAERPTEAEYQEFIAGAGAAIAKATGQKAEQFAQILPLTGKQRIYLASAWPMLEEYAEMNKAAGNDSIAEGALASAHEIKQMLVQGLYEQGVNHG